jgi:SAM-dependent methyltransferase
MGDATRYDAWKAGDSYDAYIGRWSRKVAPRFLEWLNAPLDRDWIEIGCGTGALSAAILAQAGPKSLLSVDSSEGFLTKARASVTHGPVEFRLGDAQALDVESASRDIAVSGLVLNFVPDREKALAEMKRVVRPGGVVAFYVWDYPGGGVEFMRAFWNAAAELDSAALELAENRRFPFCTADALSDFAKRAGLTLIESAAIEIPTVFEDFDDYWRPFTLGAGPAPGYCMSLEPEMRQRLKERLSASLPRQKDSSIPLKARAWAVKAIA